MVQRYALTRELNQHEWSARRNVDLWQGLWVTQKASVFRVGGLLGLHGFLLGLNFVAPRHFSD